jgi:aspartate aminotransferase
MADMTNQQAGGGKVEFSARIGRTALAATFAMAARARALRAAGHDVISLSLGEPDFPTPPHVVEAAHDAARRGETRYPPLAGTEALRAAVAEKYRREQRLDIAPADILITNGGKQAIFNVVMALVQAGDEVLIPAPAWAGYEQTVRFAGARPVFCACPQDQDFVLSPAALEAAITPRTKLLILNYPNNPTGAAIDEAGLAALAEVIRRHPHITVLSDDIYEHLLFAGEYATLAAVAPDLAPRVITLTGVSKSHAMTGWRIGFLAGPADLIRACTVVQATATSGVCSIAQAAALAALTGDQSHLATRAAAFAARRDLVLAGLAAAPGLACVRPRGAFYVFPDISGCLGKTSPAGRRLESDGDFAMALLEEAHVGTVQGAAFAASPHIRLSTASDEATLARACARIADFCRSLR